MEESFDLQKYLANGVEQLVKNALAATLTNPQESIYLSKYLVVSAAASARRAAAAREGRHIPPFLIASITSSCNLHCAGCYARANSVCEDGAPHHQLTDGQWLRVFEEARQLGVSFILLAGGEPLLRQDVLLAAATVPELFFAVFTNGTMIDSTYADLFAKYRNLMPVLSIEGEQAETDARRGDGVHQKLLDAMGLLYKNKIFFGASITVTRSNVQAVSSDGFLRRLEEKGCKTVFYVEYVPIEGNAAGLAPGPAERDYLEQRLRHLRQAGSSMIFVSFPGDEKESGGCLAAGRGFFHINSHGGAEPCPFSPYSDCNVKDVSLLEALQSPLFQRLRSQGLLEGEHDGGCVLFEKREQVEAALNQSDATLCKSSTPALSMISG